MNNQNIFQKISYKIRYKWARVSRSAKLFLIFLILAAFAGAATAYVMRPKPVEPSDTALFVYEVENGFSEQQFGFEPVYYPTILYDNGLFVCGTSHTDGAPRQKLLSQAEIATFFDNVNNSGFSDLKTKDYSAKSDFLLPADLGVYISASYEGKVTQATLRSGKQPKQFSDINAYLQSYCDENVESALSTNSYLVLSLALTDASETSVSKKVAVDSEFLNLYLDTSLTVSKQSRTIDQATFNTFKNRVGDTPVILSVGEDTYLVEIHPALREYKLAGQSEEGTLGDSHGHAEGDSDQDRDVLAATTPSVEYIWVYGADQAPAAGHGSVLQQVSLRTRDWYRSKTGKELKFGGDRALKAAKTIGQIETCPASLNCSGDKSLAAFYNLQKDIYPSLEGRLIVVLYQGSHDSCNGWGSPNSGGYGGANLNSAGTSNGGFGLLNGTGCNWENGREKVAAHELGHAMGSSHWCENLNVMVGSGCSSAVVKSDGLRAARLNGTQKTAFLGSNFFTAAGHMLRPGQRLYTGGELISVNGKWQLINQPTDGNVVSYFLPRGWYSWDSTTHNLSAPDTIMEFQTDGNLVVSTTWGKLCHIYPKPGANRLVMQDDGNIVIYNAANEALWATSFNYWRCF